MPITNPETIIDAIQTDLAAAGLTPNPGTVWSYSPPLNVLPKACPLLAVWCEDTEYELLTGSTNTVAYERRHNIIIAWYVYSESMSDTGGLGDPATVHALGNTVEQLIARLEGYAAGMPGGLGPQLVGTLQRRKLSPMEGSLWEGRIELVAEEAS